MATNMVDSPMQIYKVINLDSKEFVDTCNGQTYHIPPGSETLIPLAAVDVWFGNPDARNTEQRKYRNEEFNRLRVRAGAYENNDVWEMNKPKVKVLTITGEEVLTVVADPEGKHLNPDTSSQADTERLNEQIQMLAAQVEMLNAQKKQDEHLAESAEENQLLEEAGDVTDDEPNRPKVGNRFGLGRGQ